MIPKRNDLCPCGSGKKFKKCCLLKEMTVNQEVKPTIANEKIFNQNELQIGKEIDYIIEKTMEGSQTIVLIYPLLFFSTETGDAWLLDIDDSLALRLLDEYQKCNFVINEGKSNYSIKWTGQFEIVNQTFRYFKNEGKIK